MIHNSHFLNNFGETLRVFPNIDLTDIFSSGQLESKCWAIEQLMSLDKELGMVFICAGWYGLLGAFILESPLRARKIRSFDIDPTCSKIADYFNKSWEIDNWKFKASTLNIVDMTYPLDYETVKLDGTSQQMNEMPDTIINTSCEHIIDFGKWYNNIPEGMLLLLQSNNFTAIEEHVNCSESLKDFSETTQMTTVFYEGELLLGNYNRYMKIGVK